MTKHSLSLDVNVHVSVVMPIKCHEFNINNNVLLAEIKPEIVCVCCCAGNVEYLKTGTQDLNNSFPTQDFINRIAPYTDKVYVTTLGYIEYSEEKGKYVNSKMELNGETVDKFSSMNGNIVVTSNKKGISVNCSNNNTILKDTDWFKNNRTMPDAWKTSA